MSLQTDITLTPMGDSYRLTPGTVHGQLWLQTHFESKTWDLICSGTVRLTAESCRSLQSDAHQAGLQVCSIPTIASI
jgi:hypothetical protein